MEEEEEEETEEEEKEEEDDGMDLDEDGLEDEMWLNNPGSEGFVKCYEGFRSAFDDELFDTLVWPFLKAEQDRGGLTAEENFVHACRYAEGIYMDDPESRTLQDFVRDLIADAHRKAEALILEQGMMGQGGRLDATLLSSEEMEKQRRALFKPLAKKKPTNKRNNKARERAQNRARGRDKPKEPQPKPDNPSSGGGDY